MAVNITEILVGVNRLILLAVGWIIFLGLFFPIHAALKSHDRLRCQIEVSLTTDNVYGLISLEGADFLKGFGKAHPDSCYVVLWTERFGGVYL